jgi:hypothetical protein
MGVLRIYTTLFFIVEEVYPSTMKKTKAVT